ncbi:NAD(P)-binding protein [Metschnikowia bicuspidata var. bicuspidata NRRL YB-4993]|uniref:3beta-hydroxysteroid 3-dehydrogenase n=1 Tax=Metschnikowia bicuspidata var. bicuspidata NRRL YB-4993 TaxID=869754 RepID=A0A1A0HH97_9ASCO|nr:NAD(P)-binding protein [Metschnikowia bicuspidata var. bicuspidata NRRL YB-4993]OBA23213.1 NAD(P)-binding protein [Metschnikowia bicuspidata var. bicuspidata NRRL YB-4993]
MREGKVAVITGTNSNLGINIAYRLLDEISPSTNLTIVVTSRTLPRVQDVISKIKKHAREKLPHRTGFLEFDYLLVDFTNMVSILGAYYDLEKKFQHIDFVFVNAAQGCYSGIDWIAAFQCIFTNLLDAVTFPTYKIQRIGVKSDDDMGLVFQGNAFGPYYFLHKIKALLAGGGRIIWISSVMSGPEYLSFNDLQLLKSHEPYEGSKRLVDLIHTGSYKKLKSEHGILSYVVHPGIFTSFSFFQYLNFLTYYGMMFMFYMARFMGSQIHNISGYTAANSPVCVALNNKEQDAKLASSCDRWGKEFIDKAEIDPTGAEDVIAYMDKLVSEWDETLKHQITPTRIP